MYITTYTSRRLAIRRKPVYPILHPPQETAVKEQSWGAGYQQCSRCSQHSVGEF